ncbi:restriction endonuclease subunit S [Salegentibacter sp. JZCK2]|uniref:restriction endonuclease subunit S n=1 Tax=Salegentibacter tibetensis TaxID=2873600 RepID=UPI001CCD58CC|nr:restriction endonuclease subunit S [Salegentibacter tibetensis]MBZ9729987.1 restriction endonuclease subunit S [Salegentibacter tibetensis]
MPENWKTYNLGELVDLKQGLAINKKTNHLLCDAGINSIPLFKIRDLLNDTVEHYVKADEVPRQCIAKKEDLIYSRTGQVGHIFKGKVGCIHNNCFKIIPSEKLDSGFLYHYLKNPVIRQYANDIASGSVQKDLNHTAFKSIPIKVPENLQEQKSIASILSALDDKIELNLQMNKILEEMAMALYKHWFVDFGPFQDGEFVDSELGEIPKGWEVLTLSDVTSKITDGAHHSPKSVEEGKPMASVKDMDHWGFNIETCRKISEVDYLKLTNQGCRPLKNDVVIAKDGSYLKHAFVIEKDLDIVLLSSIAILKPNGKLNPHLLNLNLKLDSVKTRMKAIVSGAAIQRIVLKEFRKFLIIVPPKQIQDSALQSIENLMEQCWNNNSENQTLTKLRDTLLPKLISGEVRVKDVEKTLTEVL